MTIIGTHKTYEVGKIYTMNLADGEKIIHDDVPVFIIRKVTFDEWNKNRTHPERPLVFGPEFYESANYYEISTD